MDVAILMVAMIDEQDIVDEFRGVAHFSEGEIYLPLDTARLFIQRCSDASIAIIGIEAFELTGGRQLHPRVDLIADFSAVMDSALPWERKVRQTTGDAASFVNSIVGLIPDLLVNFVLRSER